MDIQIPDVNVVDTINQIANLYQNKQIDNLSPILPLLLNLEGNPFSLTNYVPMQTLYKLHDIPPKFILMCGRQVSKCVPADAVITMADGRPVFVRDLKVGDMVLSYNHDTDKFESKKIIKIFNNGIQPLRKITTDSNITVRTTANHKLFNGSAYRQSVEFSIYNNLTVCHNYKNFGNKKLNDEDCKTQCKLLLDGIDVYVWDLDQESSLMVLRQLRQYCIFENYNLHRPIKLIIKDQQAKRNIYSLFLKCGFTPTNTADGLELVGTDSRIYIEMSQYFDSHYYGIVDKLDNRAGLCLVPVQSNEIDSDEETFDIEVEDNHNYILNGVLSHNSTTLGGQGALRSLFLPYTNTLFISPLFEQIKRFSHNVVRPFIETSPVRSLMIGEKFKDQNVFQRSFKNQSNMFFTFAFNDAERVRGIAADVLAIDEVQDIDPDFMPILLATLTGRTKLGLTQLSGTPKTTDSTIHAYWEKSSQAHWVTKCDSCGEYNVAALEFGLDDMVQPKGFCCRKCSSLLNARNGFWYHMYKDRAAEFPGYHVPQPILPLHFENPRKWAELITAKMDWPTYRYHNEILGESSDVGSRLVSRQHLQSICTLDWNIEDKMNAVANMGKYNKFVMGLDWSMGGGGKVKMRRGMPIIESGTPSFTVYAIMAWAPGKHIPDLLFTERIPPHLSPADEAKYIIEMYKLFRCSMLVHDYGGGGYIRETTLTQSGFPIDHIMPVSYVRSIHAPIINPQPANNNRFRWSYSVDKTRSLSLLCAIINNGQMAFPKWNNYSETLYTDFLALIETYSQSSIGNSTYLILADPTKACDLPHAINFACMGEWYADGSYPNLAEQFGVYAGDIASHEEAMYQNTSNW